jgi:PAS domain S-box-containing protein
VITAKSGEKKPLSISTSIVNKEDGKVYVLAVIQDIALRKKAEAALRESEKKYRQLFQHAPSAIYEIDYINRKLISINDVMCTYSGYSREELMQMDPFDLFTESSMKIYQERIKSLCEGHEVPSSQEYEIKKKDGTTMFTMLNINYDLQNGIPVKARTIAHDITHRKLMEQALQESEKKYRLLADNVRDVIWTRDMDLRLTISAHQSWNSKAILQKRRWSERRRKLGPWIPLSLSEKSSPRSWKLKSRRKRTCRGLAL